MKNVTIYTTKICPYCVSAKRLLTMKGVKAYQEIKVDDHPEEKEKMVEKAYGARTVPQIFINEFHVGGCDDLYALDKKGKLDELLALDQNEQKNNSFGF